MAQVKLAIGTTPATPPAGNVVLYPESDGDIALLKSDGSGGALALQSHTHGASGLADKAVTLAKMDDLAQGTVIGRAAGAGTGAPTALTPAQVIAVLASADGTGSGLNADKLDDYEAADFALAGHTHADILGDSGWVALTVLDPVHFLAPNDGSAQVGVRKVGKQVILRGSLRVTGSISFGATSGAVTALMTLPEGYRPPTSVKAAGAYKRLVGSTYYHEYCTVDIAPDGTVGVRTVTMTPLAIWFDNISFWLD